ncbi:hypothetical protein CRYUN_Cryun03dG0078300 [Craigia yunnanensis]
MVSQFPESVSLLLILMTLIPLLVLDQSLTITGQETGKDLIAGTCNKTEYPEDCISALESDPRSFISNMTELTRIALEITATKTNNSLTVARYWVNHSPDYPSWGLATVCANYYNDSVNSMKDSLEAFDELKYEESYQSLESVNNLVTACKNVGVDVLNDVNTMMLRITQDVMVILHMLF